MSVRRGEGRASVRCRKGTKGLRGREGGTGLAVWQSVSPQWYPPPLPTRSYFGLRGLGWRSAPLAAHHHHFHLWAGPSSPIPHHSAPFPPCSSPPTGTHELARARSSTQVRRCWIVRGQGGGGGSSPCPWRQHQPWRRGAAPPPPCSRFPPRCEGASSRPERVKGGSVGESDGHGAGRASVKCRKEAKGLRSRE